ncbi:MAG: DUF4197 domain-containing protein [Rhodobacteraceae bacterium]|nr:DUF4197 domain-containing protein [Paracoccaceae bacterium]
MMTRRSFAIMAAASAAPTVALGQGTLEEGLKSLGGALFGGTDSGESTSSRNNGLGAGLSAGEIGLGLKEALTIASGAVVSQLGRTDGFFGDPVAHIPLPGFLKTARSGLKLLGQSGLLDDLELRMNRAAETATPRAKTLFVDAIEAMTIDDARQILTGPDDAATRYFQRQMTPPLTRDFSPIVTDALAEAGAVRAYDEATASVPGGLAGAAKTNLTDYVVVKGLDGVFHYFGVQEREIRRNPVKRSTDLLRRVFG